MAIFRSHQIAFMISEREKSALAEFSKERDLSVSQLVRRILVSAIKENVGKSEKFIVLPTVRHSQVNLRVSEAQREEIQQYAVSVGLVPTRFVRDAVLTWIVKTFPQIAEDVAHGKSEADRCTTTLSASKQGNPDQG